MMPLRDITDAQGVTWQVLEVIPGSRRVVGPSTGQMPNVWGTLSMPPEDPPGAPDYASGWLVFVAGAERRRLTPVPPAWQDLGERELLALLDRADPSLVPPRTRP